MKSLRFPFSVGQIVALTDPWSTFRAFRGGVHPRDPQCGIWGTRNLRYKLNRTEDAQHVKVGNIPEGGQGVVVALCAPRAFSAEAGMIIRVPMERGWVDVFYHNTAWRHLVAEDPCVRRLALGQQDTRFTRHFNVLDHLITQQGRTWVGAENVKDCYVDRLAEP